MPKDFKRILIGLFLCLSLGCGTFSFSLISSSGVLDLHEEFEEARKHYFKGEYLDSLLILSALEKQIQTEETIDDRSGILSEIHFLSGLCFLEGWNQMDRGKDSFKKALECNPSFQVKEEVYGQKATQIFLELMKPELEKAAEDNPIIEESKEKEASQSTPELSPEEKSIRIIKKNAVIRVKPSYDGTIIKRLPLGALLEVEENLEEWLKIKLPPNKDGFVVTGYIQKSFTESSSVIH